MPSNRLFTFNVLGISGALWRSSDWFLFSWVTCWAPWIGYQLIAGQVKWWGCHLKPVNRIGGLTSVWSLPFDLIWLVRPVRSYSPRIHRFQGHREAQTLLSRQSEGPIALERTQPHYSTNRIFYNYSKRSFVNDSRSRKLMGNKTANYLPLILFFVFMW
jgi:hypothetical protein